MRNGNVWELDMHKELRKYDSSEDDTCTSIPELIENTDEIPGKDNQNYYN